MSDNLFFRLWQDALAQPNKELYIAEYGYPDWFDEISTDASEIIQTLENIHEMAHMNVKDIISKSGLTQAKFAIKFCIPLRTVEDWATGKRKCADYLRLLFARVLGYDHAHNASEQNGITPTLSGN